MVSKPPAPSGVLAPLSQLSRCGASLSVALHLLGQDSQVLAVIIKVIAIIVNIDIIIIILMVKDEAVFGSSRCCRVQPGNGVGQVIIIVLMTMIVMVVMVIVGQVIIIKEEEQKLY